MDLISNQFSLYPIPDANISDNGYVVYMNRYWFVYKGAVLKDKFSSAWQCNKSRQVLELIKESTSLYDECEIQYFQYLYLPAQEIK